MELCELWKAVIIPIIVAIAIVVGTLAPRVTHEKDSVPEHIAEDVIYITTGKKIDFSENPCIDLPP